MTRFSDGTCIAEISMVGINGLDWERDFFEVGGLDYDEDLHAYIVGDVSYLIEQVEDWHHGVGDYRDDYEGEPGHTPDDRTYYVDVYEL